jgi:hypothetical protein
MRFLVALFLASVLISGALAQINVGGPTHAIQRTLEEAR